MNSYPTLDVTQELVKGEYTAGAPIVLKVALSRDVDEEEEDDGQTVVAPFYPLKKIANWWLVVGDPATKQLLVIVRITTLDWTRLTWLRARKAIAMKMIWTARKINCANIFTNCCCLCSIIVIAKGIIPIRGLEPVGQTRIVPEMEVTVCHDERNMLVENLLHPPQLDRQFTGDYIL